MSANGSAVDHLYVAIVGSGDGVHHPIPYARFSSAHEAIVTGGTRAITLRQIAPWRTGTQHPEDTVQNAAIIDARNTSRLVGQQRLNDASLEVGQIVSAHADAESEFPLGVKSVVWSMHTSVSACRHSFASHVCPAVPGAARRPMLHHPPARFFLTN